jgi:hypothetical protein
VWKLISMDEITLASSLNIVGNIRSDLAINAAVNRAATILTSTTLVQAKRLSE